MEAAGWEVLTTEEQKELKKLKQKRRPLESPAAKKQKPQRGGHTTVTTLPDTNDIFRICHDPKWYIVTYHQPSGWCHTHEVINLSLHAFCLNVPFLSDSCPQQPNRWVSTSEWESPSPPWQAFKMALVAPSFNTPPHTRYSPPPTLAKESSSVGRALAPHRLAPRGLHP